MLNIPLTSLANFRGHSPSKCLISYHCGVIMENDSLKFEHKLCIDTDRLLDLRDEGFVIIVGRRGDKYCLFCLFMKITFKKLGGVRML